MAKTSGAPRHQRMAFNIAAGNPHRLGPICQGRLPVKSESLTDSRSSPKGRAMAQDLSACIVDSELAQQLDCSAATLSLSPGEVLFRQGELPRGVYIVRSGTVELTRRASSGEVELRVKADAGSLLALPAVVGSEPSNLTAEACASALIAFIPRDVFLEMMRAEARLSLKVLEVLSADVRYSRYALRAIAT